MKQKEQSVFSMVAGNGDENNKKEDEKNNVGKTENKDVESNGNNNEKNGDKNSEYGSVKNNVDTLAVHYGTTMLDLGKLDMKKIKKVGKKNKRERFEETHKKATFWIKKELLEAFNNAVDHGLKSEKINEAIYDWLIRQQEKN